MKLSRLPIVLALATIATTATSAAPVSMLFLDCAPKSQDICREGKACIRGKAPNLILKVDSRESTYSRCEQRSADNALVCDSYPVKIFDLDGDVTIQPREGSFFVKISRNLRFTEVLGYGHRVEITRGQCTVAPPALNLLPALR